MHDGQIGLDDKDGIDYIGLVSPTTHKFVKQKPSRNDKIIFTKAYIRALEGYDPATPP